MTADFGAVPDSWMPDWAALLEGAPYVHMDLPCGVQTADGTRHVRAHGLSFSLTEKQQQFTRSFRHYKQRGPSSNKHWGWTRWDAIQSQGPIGSIPADADDRSMDDFLPLPFAAVGPALLPTTAVGPANLQEELEAGITVFQNPEWKDYMSVGLTVTVPEAGISWTGAMSQNPEWKKYTSRPSHSTLWLSAVVRRSPS